MAVEQAYAPPYSSAKDPVNIAGFVADNILSGKMKIAHWREISKLSPSVLLVDVRTSEEYSLGTIPGAVNIPVDELRNRLDELPRGKEIILFCAVGLRGYLAYRILAQNGYTHIRNLSGGYKTWSVATAGAGNNSSLPSRDPGLALQADLSCRPCSVFGEKDCFRGDWACMTRIMPMEIVNRACEIIKIAKVL